MSKRNGETFGENAQPRSKDSFGSRARDTFGRFTESFARAMGTTAFIVGQTAFIVVWMFWNTVAPQELRFDSSALGFTALTLVLSLQAAYAAPLLLLAQNRQDDRSKVQIEQDRKQAERNLDDTEFLAREVVSLRLAVEELATEKFVRDEIKDTIGQLSEQIAELKNQLVLLSGAAVSPSAVALPGDGSGAADGALAAAASAAVSADGVQASVEGDADVEKPGRKSAAKESTEAAAEPGN